MSDPLRQLRQIPWLSLFLIALLTTFWLFVAEFCLLLGAQQFSVIGQAIDLLYGPLLGLLVSAVTAVGMGMLAVWFLEIVYPRIFLNLGTLWALIFCLILAIVLRLRLPFPNVLLQDGPEFLIGLIIGVFWQGKADRRR